MSKNGIKTAPHQGGSKGKKEFNSFAEAVSQELMVLRSMYEIQRFVNLFLLDLPEVYEKAPKVTSEEAMFVVNLNEKLALVQMNGDKKLIVAQFEVIHKEEDASKDGGDIRETVEETQAS